VKNGISLSQRQYIEEIVRTFSFHKGNKVYTPMEPHSTPRKFLESEDEKFDPHLYRQLIGSLMQLATWTRPDIAYSVSVLSQFFSNPARRHWTLARRVVNYLKTTQDSVLFLSSEQGGPVTDSPMLKAAGNSELLTFTDSDFASCEETRKSRSGACIFFCNSLIYWKSGKQNHVSRSTTEAEFYALLEGITEVEFLQDVIHFAYKVDKRIFNCKYGPITCDNSSAGKIASSIESIARTKHIEVAHLWIQQEVAKERIKVHYVNTENQAADIFTKSLARPLFEKFKKRLGLISSKEM
jgi:hypothetical protein